MLFRSKYWRSDLIDYQSAVTASYRYIHDGRSKAHTRISTSEPSARMSAGTLVLPEFCTDPNVSMLTQNTEPTSQKSPLSNFPIRESHKFSVLSFLCPSCHAQYHCTTTITQTTHNTTAPPLLQHHCTPLLHKPRITPLHRHYYTNHAQHHHTQHGLWSGETCIQVNYGCLASWRAKGSWTLRWREHEAIAGSGSPEIAPEGEVHALVYEQLPYED